MFWRKYNLVVGLTTFHNELLRISVPALGRVKQKFLLIIYNDNPTTTVSKRTIRKLGYRGGLKIINGDENLGILGARLRIIDAVSKLKTRPQWTIFCNDDDIITDLRLANVSPENFAIIQNKLMLKHRVADLLRAMQNPNDILPDDENIILAKPHIGFAGNFIRTDILLGLGNLLSSILSDIHAQDNRMEYRSPMDAIMWSWLNIYAHTLNTDSTPIYMDTVNYISMNLDSDKNKYGRNAVPARNAADFYRGAMNAYNAILMAALGADDNAAAPAGQE